VAAAESRAVGPWKPAGPVALTSSFLALILYRSPRVKVSTATVTNRLHFVVSTAVKAESVACAGTTNRFVVVIHRSARLKQ